MLHFLFQIFLLYQIPIFPGFTSAQEEENSIREKLLRDYDKTLSPVLFQRTSLTSNMWLSVLRIRGLDEAKGEFILEGILAVVWFDDRLSFESDTLPYVLINSDDVWIPHVNVLNRVEQDEMTLKTKVFLLKSSLVGWAPRYVFRTSCIPNLKFFPFDRHTCNVIIMSHSDEGDILPANFSKQSFAGKLNVLTQYLVENNLWRIVSINTTSKQMQVDIDVTGYGGVFSFEIERTMPLIALGILCPCLVSVLLLLTTFWMKAGAVTRTGMSATSVLVSAGNLFTFGRILPVNGATTPIIVQYVSCTLVLSTISALQSTIVSVMSRCKTQPPMSYTTIIEKLPRWTLYLLALAPITDESVNRSFQFSKLVDSDNAQQLENERTISANTDIEGPWAKHIVLFDRLVFYLFGLVVWLLVLSVLFTE